MIPWIRGSAPFPPIEKALVAPNGLLCAGGDLAPARLIDAYSHGIFPWYSEGDPILWWSPDPRMVLFPEELRVSHSLRKRLAHGDYETRFDTAFGEVIEQCAAPREGQSGTWIVPEMIAAYTTLHEMGFVHSVARVPDASKVALVALVERLRAGGFRLIDCQQATAHLASLGARQIPRAEFAQRLRESIQYPPSGSRWGPG